MDDDRKLLAEIDREEAKLARRLEREGWPRVGPEDVEAARLMSVILAASGMEDEVADETAVRLLAHWPWDVIRRSVDLWRQARERGSASDSYADVARIAETLVEADRIATLRHRAREGDKDAAAELVAVKRALRIASRHD